MPRVAGLVVALLVLTALAACSDGGELDPEAEAELLEEAILTVDDLPDDFEESEPNDDDDDEDFDECLEDADFDPDSLDDATVADEGPVAFVVEAEETFGSIEAELRSLDDTGPAEERIEAFGDDELIDCLGEQFEESAEEDGQTIEDVELEEIDAAVDGDSSGALRITGDVSGFDFVAELHVVVVGDHAISVETVSLEGGLDDEVVESAFETMIERLEAGS